MPNTLEQAATNAGLTDMDLLKVADASLPPKVAVAQLRQRYPGAFPDFDARTAPKKEVDRRWRELQREQAAERAHAINERAIARMAEKYGDKK
ncbi:hypothetical protein [Novacetimonas maltaceti]|uniref:Uncharacterized protein n=1 Tax=Novacetimonas maltaceti TaxID=1203393 RepID=A0A2S3VXA8_9PROT|nr:hypothetical protein [Novacetimonas maltaceti]POF61259.1 hypothetical protein KMAL_31170 [Novacetimonas maltaceti]